MKKKAKGLTTEMLKSPNLMLIGMDARIQIANLVNKLFPVEVKPEGSVRPKVNKYDHVGKNAGDQEKARCWRNYVKHGNMG